MITPLAFTTHPPSLARESCSREDRKMRLLRRSGLFGANMKGATIKRACTAEDLRKAYRLVHDVFIENGFLSPEPSGIRMRIFEMSSDTATFIAVKDDEVVGVLSVVADSSDLGLPSDAAFKAELDALRATGVLLCELTNQAVALEYRQSAISSELMRCAVAHAMQAGYREAIATVSPSHHGFYELMGFGLLGAERSYSTKRYDPVIALHFSFERLRRPPEGRDETARFVRQFAVEENHFAAQVAGWSRLARRQFLNADLLEQLFIHERNFVAECTAQELSVLQQRWGQELFQLVTGLGMIAPPAQARSGSQLGAGGPTSEVETPAGEIETDHVRVTPKLRPPQRRLSGLRRYFSGLLAAGAISSWSYSASPPGPAINRATWTERGASLRN